MLSRLLVIIVTKNLLFKILSSISSAKNQVLVSTTFFLMINTSIKVEQVIFLAKISGINYLMQFQ